MDFFVNLSNWKSNSRAGVVVFIWIYVLRLGRLWCRLLRGLVKWRRLIGSLLHLRMIWLWVGWLNLTKLWSLVGAEWLLCINWGCWGRRVLIHLARVSRLWVGWWEWLLVSWGVELITHEPLLELVWQWNDIKL